MPSSDLPDIVVVGAASRDRVEDDPRGWRLGGAVSYAALAIARLGLRVGALVGATLHSIERGDPPDRLRQELRRVLLRIETALPALEIPTGAGLSSPEPA